MADRKDELTPTRVKTTGAGAQNLAGQAKALGRKMEAISLNPHGHSKKHIVNADGSTVTARNDGSGVMKVTTTTPEKKEKEGEGEKLRTRRTVKKSRKLCPAIRVFWTNDEGGYDYGYMIFPDGHFNGAWKIISPFDDQIVHNPDWHTGYHRDYMDPSFYDYSNFNADWFGGWDGSEIHGYRQPNENAPATVDDIPGYGENTNGYVWESVTEVEVVKEDGTGEKKTVTERCNDIKSYYQLQAPFDWDPDQYYEYKWPEIGKWWDYYHDHENPWADCPDPPEEVTYNYDHSADMILWMETHVYEEQLYGNEEYQYYSDSSVVHPKISWTETQNSTSLCKNRELVSGSQHKYGQYFEQNNVAGSGDKDGNFGVVYGVVTFDWTAYADPTGHCGCGGHTIDWCWDTTGGYVDWTSKIYDRRTGQLWEVEIGRINNEGTGSGGWDGFYIPDYEDTEIHPVNLSTHSRKVYENGNTSCNHTEPNRSSFENFQKFIEPFNGWDLGYTPSTQNLFDSYGPCNYSHTLICHNPNVEEEENQLTIIGVYNLLDYSGMVHMHDRDGERIQYRGKDVFCNFGYYYLFWYESEEVTEVTEIAPEGQGG